MKKLLTIVLLALALSVNAQEDIVSYTEGVITSDFVPEAAMKRDL